MTELVHVYSQVLVECSGVILCLYGRDYLDFQTYISFPLGRSYSIKRARRVSVNKCQRRQAIPASPTQVVKGSSSRVVTDFELNGFHRKTSERSEPARRLENRGSKSAAGKGS